MVVRCTPEVVAYVRDQYLNSDDTVRTIAENAGLSLRTAYQLVQDNNWKRRMDRAPRGLPAATRLFEEAKALEAQFAAMRARAVR